MMKMYQISSHVLKKYFKLHSESQNTIKLLKHLSVEKSMLQMSSKLDQEQLRKSELQLKDALESQLKYEDRIA